MTTDHGIRSLSFAVRPGVVLKYLGQLLFMLGLLAVVPLCVSVITGDRDVSIRLGVVIAVLGAAGYASGRMGTPKRMQANEALAITGLAFVTGGFVMSFPLGASGLPFMDAIFESVSGITTTGLSVAGPLDGVSKSFLFSRAWMQWVGGLGIVVLSVALLIDPGLNASALGFSEIDRNDVAGGIRANARRVTAVYLVLTVVGLVLLLCTGMSVFDAVVHTLAGISTGGFSTYDESIGGLGGFGVQACVTLVCLMGATSLGLYPQLLGKGRRAALSSPAFRGLVLMCLVSTCALGFSFWALDGMGTLESALRAPVMALSAQTTAGFSDMDVSDMGGASKLILIMSMAVGGSMGSTAGGFKLLRFMILLKVVWLMVMRTAAPSSAVSVFSMGGRVVEPGEIRDSLTIILLFIGVCTVSWLMFLAYGFDPLDSLFEVVSATGTVGLSAGLSGPGLPGPLKGVLCMDMLLGRIEFVALMVVLYPGTWFGKIRRE